MGIGEEELPMCAEEEVHPVLSKGGWGALSGRERCWKPRRWPQADQWALTLLSGDMRIFPSFISLPDVHAALLTCIGQPELLARSRHFQRAILAT